MFPNSNEQYTPQVISETTLVKSGNGVLGGLFCSSVTGSPTCTVYDNTSGTSNKVVDTFVLTAATPFPLPLLFQNGLNIVISGTASLTVFYN